jgi:hypothetical protein
MRALYTVREEVQREGPFVYVRVFQPSNHFIKYVIRGPQWNCIANYFTAQAEFIKHAQHEKNVDT